jgi:hypothetical protein
VPWFYYLLLILEADSLTPLDFETIRLLLLKMRVKDELCKEYSNLHLAGDMINNGKIIEHLIRYLTPMIKEAKDPRERHIFGLANQEY